MLKVLAIFDTGDSELFQNFNNLLDEILYERGLRESIPISSTRDFLRRRTATISKNLERSNIINNSKIFTVSYDPSKEIIPIHFVETKKKLGEKIH